MHFSMKWKIFQGGNIPRAPPVTSRREVSLLVQGLQIFSTTAK